MARREELRSEWVESRQGLIVDEQWLAKKYAKARADHRVLPQEIWKHWNKESWVIHDAGKPRPEEHSFLMTIKPSARNPRKTKRTMARRRKKNLSTGAWIAIAVGVGVVVPVVVIGAVMAYGVKRFSDAGVDPEDFYDIDEPRPDRPIPSIPPIS